MKRILFVVLLATSLLFACSESPEKYKSRALVVADTIMSYSDLSYSIASDRASAWRTAIFDNRYTHLDGSVDYTSNWQDVLIKFDNDYEFAIKKAKNMKKTIDKMYKDIKDHPDKSEEFFETMKSLYENYAEAYDLAVNSSGSLQSYTGEINRLYPKYKSLKNTLNLEKQ